MFHNSVLRLLCNCKHYSFKKVHPYYKVFYYNDLIISQYFATSDIIARIIIHPKMFRKFQKNVVNAYNLC